MRPPQQQQIRKVSISVLVMSLPLLYVSFLHPPPSTLFKDTTFWFLMSNSIIIIIAADSGMLFFRSPSAASDDNLFYLSRELTVVDHGASVPMASDELAVANEDHALVVKGVEEEVASKPNTNKNHELVVDGEERVESKQSTNMDHALVVEGEEVAREPITNMNHALVVIGEEEEVEEEERELNNALVEEEEEVLSPFYAAEDVAYEPTVIKNHALVETSEPWPMLVAGKSLKEEEELEEVWSSHSHPHGVQDKSVVAREGHLRPSATEGSRPEESELWKLSNEELNRRVEEFIRRFNREMRLQVEQEAAV